MIHTRYKKVLLVAPEISKDQFSADYDNVKHVCALSQLFPCIYELNPNLIVFDYNYVSKDFEKIVRRIRANNFYSKIKICCFKTKPELKTDGLLKAIGVDYFVYQEELQSSAKSKTVTHIFSWIFDISTLGIIPHAN